MGVFLGYASRRGYTLLDRRLYLPKEWFDADHRQRREACRIPADTALAGKTELAGRMVEAAVAGGLRAAWLTCDEWYGRDTGFLDGVAGRGLRYLAEVSQHTMVWPLVEPATGQARPRPETWLPPRNASGKGRTPVRRRRHPDSLPPLRIDDLAAQLPATAWRRYRVLEGARGPLVADFATVRVVAVRDGLPGPEGWALLHRPVADPGEDGETKRYLSNAPADTPLATVVRVSGMRWPIESCFEEGKGEVGLDQYELRFWRGWQHHMTMVILAHHFLVRLRVRRQARGGAPTAGDRSADIGPGGLPGRPAAGQPAPGAPGARRGPRLGARRLLATPQPRRLPLAPQTHPPTPGGARAINHVSLSY